MGCSQRKAGLELSDPSCAGGCLGGGVEGRVESGVMVRGLDGPWDDVAGHWGVVSP